MVTIGIGTLACVGAVSRGADHGPLFDATQRSLAGLILGQLIITVLGALTVTSEYSTGMIRTSLTVQPRRGTVLAAKGVVFFLVSLVTGLVASFVSFFIGQAILSSKHLNVTLGDPNVLRAVIGGALFLAVCGMLAFGLGTLLRHTAGAITASIGLLFVLFVLINFLPSNWQNHVDKWIPFNAGSQIWSTIARAGQPADVLAVDRVRGVRRLRGDRDHRGGVRLPEAGRVGPRVAERHSPGGRGAAARRVSLPGGRRAAARRCRVPPGGLRARGLRPGAGSAGTRT